MFIPFLNVYFRQNLDFSGRQIGILTIFPSLMMLIVAPLVASLADRRRWRIPLLKMTISGFGFTLFLATFPRTFSVWVTVRFMMALFIGPTLPLADSIIASMSIRHKLNYGSILWEEKFMIVLALKPFFYAIVYLSGERCWFVLSLL